MPMFRKKPVVIFAFQYRAGEQDGTLAADVVAGTVCYPEDGTMLIRTLEGEMVARPGDWIIRGVKGELYPCKPDIFAATYEPAPAPAPSPAPQSEDEDDDLFELNRFPMVQGAPSSSRQGPEDPEDILP